MIYGIKRNIQKSSENEDALMEAGWKVLETHSPILNLCFMLILVSSYKHKQPRRRRL